MEFFYLFLSVLARFHNILLQIIKHSATQDREIEMVYPAGHSMLSVFRLTTLPSLYNVGCVYVNKRGELVE
jgi:hypothetical protein